MGLDRLRPPSQAVPWLQDLLPEEHLGRLLLHPAPQVALRQEADLDGRRDLVPRACRWARMEHHVYPIGRKNFMERLNQTFKDRVECFDDYFPCWKEECSRRHVFLWIRTFSFYYNFVREHSELGFPPALYDSPLKDRSEADRFISLVQEAIQ